MLLAFVLRLSAYSLFQPIKVILNFYKTLEYTTGMADLG